MAGLKLLPRFAAEPVANALKDTPVVMVTGPRQCGKTTLVRDLVPGRREYLTLDDPTVRAAAQSDPLGLVRRLNRTTLDEVQWAPDLLRAIKLSVDQDRQPGRFLLTGSANILALPRVSESLAGRMEIVELLPLSRSEIRGRRPGFLRAAFAGRVERITEAMIGPDLIDAVLTGGYPEMVRRSDNPRRRQTWARDYVRALVQRDVREIAEVEKLEQIPRLLRVLAHFAGQLTNFAQVGAQIGFDDKTTKKYVAILEHLFLVRRVEPWFQNRAKRLIKSPKLHFVDSGLLASLVGATPERVLNDRNALGAILETYVFSELLKLASWFDGSLSLYHYRDKDQDEVDLVMESDDGSLIGIEVKAGATAHPDDFRGLRKLEAACGDRFKLGLVLYDSKTAVPFGEKLCAAPLSCLWS